MDYDAHAQKFYDAVVRLCQPSFGEDAYNSPFRKLEVIALAVEAVFEVGKDIQRIANTLEARK